MKNIAKVKYIYMYLIIRKCNTFHFFQYLLVYRKTLTNEYLVYIIIICQYKSSIRTYISSISIKKKKKKRRRLRDIYIFTRKWNKYSSSQTTSLPDLFAIEKIQQQHSPVSLSPGTPRLSLLSLMKASAVDVKV